MTPAAARNDCLFEHAHQGQNVYNSPVSSRCAVKMRPDGLFGPGVAAPLLPPDSFKVYTKFVHPALAILSVDLHALSLFYLEQRCSLQDV